MSESDLKQSHSRVWLLVEMAALGLILALAALLRFPNLAVNPGWYSDEGTLVAIAQKLAQGGWQYLALNQSMLIVARPPVFLLILAGLFRVLEPGIAVLRLLTASLGMASVLLTYLLVRRVGRSPGLALLSALFLAIYPQAVLYSRIGFSYNLLGSPGAPDLFGCLELFRDEKNKLVGDRFIGGWDRHRIRPNDGNILAPAAPGSLNSWLAQDSGSFGSGGTARSGVCGLDDG